MMMMMMMMIPEKEVVDQRESVSNHSNYKLNKTSNIVEKLKESINMTDDVLINSQIDIWLTNLQQKGMNQ